MSVADTTGIAWCRSTFNPWIGCTKVAPECDNCYAAELDANRYSKTLDGGTKQAPVSHWGPRAPRHRTGTWRQPIAWNKAQRKALEAGSNEPWRVFGGSLMDWADNDVDPAWRAAYWHLIRETPYLTWLLLTKRAPNIAKMLPVDFSRALYPHVWLGTTAGTQARVDTDGMRLLEFDAHVLFLSIEPQLEHINLWAWLAKARGLGRRVWVIVGGESGTKARDFRVAWALDLRKACIRYDVPIFIKQLGRRVLDRNDAGFDGCDERSWPLRPDGCDPEIDFEPHGFQERAQGADCRVLTMDGAAGDPEEWPELLRMRQFPETWMPAGPLFAQVGS